MKYSSGIHFLVFFWMGRGGFALSLIIAFKAALCHLLSLNKKGKKREGRGGLRRNKGYSHLGERGGKLSIASLHLGLACHEPTSLCWYKVSIKGLDLPASSGVSHTTHTTLVLRYRHHSDKSLKEITWVAGIFYFLQN